MTLSDRSRGWRVVLIILILIFGFSGVALAAEQSLPGDTLYPVKVHGTERLRAFLIFSDEAKVAWETERLERRLREIKVIVKKRRLDKAVASQLRQRVQESSQRVQQAITLLEEEGDDDAAATLNSRYTAAINVHEVLLLQLKEGAQGNPELESFLEMIQRMNQEIFAELEIDESPVDDAPGPITMEAAQEEMEKARREIAELEVLLEQRNAQLSPLIASRVTTQIMRLRNLLDESIRTLVTEELIDSLRFSKQVTRNTHKLKLFLRSLEEFESERESGSG